MFSWYKCLIVSLVFSHLGFWSGSLFLIAPFPDLCLLVLFFAPPPPPVPSFLRILHMKFDFEQTISEKIKFYIYCLNDFRQRSRNDLDFEYSHNFINSIKCLFLPTFRSQATKLPEKSNVFFFSGHRLQGHVSGFFFSGHRLQGHVFCFTFEPPYEKTNNLHMRKQRRRSASRLPRS